MKSLFFIIFITSITSTLFAQTKAIKNFYNQYNHLEGVEDIKVQGWLLKLASSFSDDDDAQHLLRKITSLRVLTMENGNLVTPDAYNQLIKSVKQDAFEELMQVKQDGQKIEFLIREKGDQITDLLLLISGNDGFTLLSLEGMLKFSDLNNLNIEVEGSEHLKKLPKEKKDVPRA